jgi:hypothetical protein
MVSWRALSMLYFSVYFTDPELNYNHPQAPQFCIPYNSHPVLALPYNSHPVLALPHLFLYLYRLRHAVDEEIKKKIDRNCRKVYLK